MERIKLRFSWPYESYLMVRCKPPSQEEREITEDMRKLKKLTNIIYNE